MLSRPLARALAMAIWNTSLRSFAPYDGRRDERYAGRDDERYGGRYDRRDERRQASTLTRPGRKYRYSDQDDGPPRSPTRGRTVALVGLALAAVLVVAATLAIEAQLAGGRRPTRGTSTSLADSGTGTPGAGTPVVSATATTASSMQPKRWAQMGPAYAQRAAFAESAPTRMYACGFQGANTQTGPISLLASRDSGSTWQTLSTPAKGTYCDVRASTTTPQNVALFASALCDQESCTSTDPNQLYHSTDGGTHWSVAQLPATSGTPATPTYTFAWAGATLFVEAVTAGQSGSHYLAASTNGGAFAWVDQNITGLPAGMTPIAGELRAIGNTVYVTFSGGGCANPQAGCIAIARTTNGGATWTHVAPTYVGHAYTSVGGIRLVAGAPGAPLIGAASSCQCTAAPLLRSTDSGATWTELPGFSSGYHAREFWTVETPDGTVYATLEQDHFESIGIYVLAPGASAWRLVAYPAGGQSWALEAATWDASGHPAGLWGWSWSNSEVDGLWRQAS